MFENQLQWHIATFEDQVKAFYTDAWVSGLPRFNTLSLCHRRKRPRLVIGRLIGGPSSKWCVDTSMTFFGYGAVL